MERTTPPVVPFGSWPSPLSAQWASAASPRIDGAALRGDEVWWGQSLPEEGGRTAVVRRGTDGTRETLLPAPWSARSRVHEYGGGAWAALDDGAFAFVEKSDQRIWLVTAGNEPVALTPEDATTRYGGLRWQHGVLLAVREQHPGGSSPRRSIVSVALSHEDSMTAVTEVVGGSDFLAQPALSPDGTRLAWVAWNHPHMPWDRTEVRVGTVEDGRVSRWNTVTSGATAALQPCWRGEDELIFIDETSGRWNLWSLKGASLDAPYRADATTSIAATDADTGGGLWVLGLQWYAPLDGERIAAVRTNGADQLVLLDADGAAHPVDLPATARVAMEDADGTRVLVSGVAPEGAGLWLVTHAGAVERVTGGEGMDPEWTPLGREVTFEGKHGEVYAFDFAPKNPEVSAPSDERPPYVVFVHGGPTAHVGGVADAKTAYFTSRGIGVLDVNYGGSTGYGRAYRERLRGQWGIVDVDDVAAAAAGLVASGAADGARLAIEGGSAGGWTVLGALVGTDTFAAGISRYGVGDARTLAADTHDFEARYLDGLIGELPADEALYVERSPLSHAERFRVPLLLLQGAEDEVVPMAQAEAIRDALAAHAVPHSLVVYEGEGHGFRRSETIIHALESELAFLGAVFGFDTPGVPPLTLD